MVIFHRFFVGLPEAFHSREICVRDMDLQAQAAVVHPRIYPDSYAGRVPGLVNIQKAIENGHRNSGLTH